MAYAFALARIRRTDDARSEFEKAIASDYWNNDLRPELRQLFEAEIQRSHA
jgi:hypothetical protein